MLLYFDYRTFDNRISSLSSLRCWLSDESPSENEDHCINGDMYVDGCGDVLYSSLSSFIGILKEALGDRVTNIASAPTYRQKVLCGVQIGVHQIK